MRKALQINIDGTMKHLDLEAPEGSLRLLQGAVGGYIQAIDINDNITMWLNEEGKLDGLDTNLFGTLLFRSRFGDVDTIVGNIVLTGGTDDEGETLGLTDEQLKSFEFLVS